MEWSEVEVKKKGKEEKKRRFTEIRLREQEKCRE